MHLVYPLPASRPPPPTQKKKFLHNHCFQFLLGIVPREIEDDGHAKFWRVNKMHYGLCENGELRLSSTNFTYLNARACYF